MRPVLSSTRLRLEPLTAEHSDLVVALDGDEEVMRHLPGGVRSRDEVLADWLPLMLDDGIDPAALSAGLGFWVGSTSGGLAGWWCLHGRGGGPVTADLSDGVAWLGARLTAAAQHDGLAEEGSRALLHHAFDRLGLLAVHAEAMAANVGSCRVMEHLGMSRIRSFDDGISPQGGVVYAVTREEFARLTTAPGKH